MPHIMHELTINDKAYVVYRALTSRAGLRSWWTKHTQAKSEVGHVNEHKFLNGEIVFRMKVEQLEKNELVLWSTQEPSPPGWKGTEVRFELEELELADDEYATRLRFAHRDWRSYKGDFAMVNYSWAGYLTSLKAYVETGEGQPYIDPD